MSAALSAPPTCRTRETALAGLRRADYVRVVEAERPRFFLVGVGHRFPVERELSPSVALELMQEMPTRQARPRKRDL